MASTLRARPRLIGARASATGCAGRHAPFAGLSGYVHVTSASKAAPPRKTSSKRPPTGKDSAQTVIAKYKKQHPADTKSALIKPLALIELLLLLREQTGKERFYRVRRGRRPREQYEKLTPPEPPQW